MITNRSISIYPKDLIAYVMSESVVNLRHTFGPKERLDRCTENDQIDDDISIMTGLHLPSD